MHSCTHVCKWNLNYNSLNHIKVQTPRIWIVILLPHAHLAVSFFSDIKSLWTIGASFLSMCTWPQIHHLNIEVSHLWYDVLYLMVPCRNDMVSLLEWWRCDLWMLAELIGRLTCECCNPIQILCHSTLCCIILPLPRNYRSQCTSMNTNCLVATWWQNNASCQSTKVAAFSSSRKFKFKFWPATDVGQISSQISNYTPGATASLDQHMNWNLNSNSHVISHRWHVNLSFSIVGFTSSWTTHTNLNKTI